jgi:hypothetical protein
MEFAVSASVRRRLAAEMEIGIERIAEGPAAVHCAQAGDRLSFPEGDCQIVGLRGCWQIPDVSHKQSYHSNRWDEETVRRTVRRR